MNKFNLPLRNLAKDRRAKRAHRRRLQSGNSSLRLCHKARPPTALSGKKKRQLLRKWRRAQKEALKSGLVNMHDIEMIAAENGGGSGEEVQHDTDRKSCRVFSLKKRAKLKLKRSKVKGKHNAAASSDRDTMME